jgi:flavodoxin
MVADPTDHPLRNRRTLLRQWAGLLTAAGTGSLLPGRVRAQSRSLVAYYSRTGHTRQAARVIAQAVGADLFEIVPAVPYPTSYQDTVDLNSRQRAAGEFPGVAQLIPDLAQFDTVFLGYPIWAVDLPRLLYPFLRQQDFGRKVLAPFCTYAMSGLARTEQTLRQLCPQARVLPGLALQGGARGHNTLVTRIGADARRRSEQWGRQTLANGAR